MNYGCVNCVFDLNEDYKKFEPVFRKGKVKVKLNKITETLYQCPKCGAQHIHPNFKVSEAHQKIREKRQARNIKNLKKHYRPFFGCSSCVKNVD